eukprot:3940061-Rhodomonas_salina.2
MTHDGISSLSLLSFSICVSVSLWRGAAQAAEKVEEMARGQTDHVTTVQVSSPLCTYALPTRCPVER